MEVFKISKFEAKDILYGDNENFKKIRDEEYDTSRWSSHRELIVQRISDEKFFRAFYSRGLSESQEETPWEDEDEVDFKEVFKVEKVVVDYE